MRIISGIQPTGQLHIGNYLGAIKQWTELQNKEECIFFIADLHSLTVPYEPKELQNNILEAAIAYLAAGIDPSKSIFFVQSKVKEHTELTWILNSVCPVGDLERMIQFKEKAKQFKKNINAGLLTYPTLMAADILLYKAESVPVGKDQVQHIELAREIARRFNQRYGKTFPEPKPLLSEGAKIMSLTDPKKKMSKSSGPEGCLFLFDEPETIRKKIMSAVTDTGKEVKFSARTKPGISNLLIVYSLISGKKVKELEGEFKNKNYSEFKKSLAEALVNFLEPFRNKKRELVSRKIYIDEILRMGANKARSLAESTMQEVSSKTGLM